MTKKSQSLKILSVLAFILFFSTGGPSRTALALDRQTVFENAKLVSQFLLEQQSKDGSWLGDLEPNPVGEAVVLVLAKKLNIPIPPTLRDGMVHRLLNWRGSLDYWPISPKGEPSLDTTGTALLALRYLGLDVHDRNFQNSWSWFERQGGMRAMSLQMQLLLTPLGIGPNLSTPSIFTVFSLSFGRGVPGNILEAGSARGLLVAFLVWDYYQNAIKLGLPVSALDPERRASAGNQFGRGIDFFDGSMNPEFWAQEGLGYLLANQSRSGRFYILFQGIIALAALDAAQGAGAGDFSKVIQLGFQGIFGQWKRGVQGEDFLQVSVSSGWDTPLAVLSLLTSSEVRDSLPKEKMKRALDSILRTQTFVKGDWRYTAPHLNSGSWSFDPEDTSHPDTDVAALNLEAIQQLISFLKMAPSPEIQFRIQAGNQWILGLQNKTGAFPAWEKDTSDLMSSLMKLIQPNTEFLADTGQSDLNSRLVRYFKNYANPSLDARVSRAIDSSCQFVKSKAQMQGAVQTWEGDWASNYLYGTVSAVVGLLAAECISLDQAVPALQWIASLQDLSGGWGESLESYHQKRYVRGESNSFQSAFVLNGLLQYELARKALMRLDLPSFEREITRGVEFLLARILPSGMVQERTFSGVLMKGEWMVDYGIGPITETLRALSYYLEWTKR